MREKKSWKPSAAPCAFDITGCAAKRPETQAEPDIQVSLRNLKSANDTERKRLCREAFAATATETQRAFAASPDADADPAIEASIHSLILDLGSAPTLVAATWP